MKRRWLLVLFVANAASAAVAQEAALAGTVFVDGNGNGVRDRGEPGVAEARVSDQVATTRSGPDGRWSIADSHGLGLVFVAAPPGHRVVPPFWRKVAAASDPRRIDFPVRPEAEPRDFMFVHGSDTHVSPASVERIRAARALVEVLRPAFVLMTGDLVKDALRVGEAVAAGYFELYVAETSRFPVPVWNAPGNHDIFGIERALSQVSPSHPLYGKRMYRERLGPNYYSFDFGGVHFVALDTVDVDDLWYYGHVDATQLEWLEGDLATVASATPVVTFNHIPLVTSVEMLGGYRDEPPAPTLIRVGGKDQFRHVVANVGEVLARLQGHPYPLALGGHMHAREALRFEAEGLLTRFHQAAAIVGPSEAGPLHLTSGLTLYRVQDGKIDDGTFLPLP